MVCDKRANSQNTLYGVSHCTYYTVHYTVVFKYVVNKHTLLLCGTKNKFEKDLERNCVGNVCICMCFNTASTL